MIRKLVKKWFKFYTLDDFMISLYEVPITLTQLHVLYELQHKATFDYKNKTVLMTPDIRVHYESLLTPQEKHPDNGDGTRGFVFLAYREHRVIVKPNET